MLYFYACLSISRFCHALCSPWLCSSMVISNPLVDYWGVTTCEAHPRDSSFLDAYPLFALCDVACHACFTPPVWLSLLLCILFACLPTYSCMSLCLLVSSSIIPTILCGFKPDFDTWDPESLLGISLDGTCVVYTPILWNYEHSI